MNNSDNYVISFHESLNDITQNCQMDILVRYFDSIDRKVRVRYLDSKVLGHSAHQDLFDHFSSAIMKLNSNKIYQISMDGPSKCKLKILKEEIYRIDNYCQKCVLSLKNIELNISIFCPLNFPAYWRLF